MGGLCSSSVVNELADDAVAMVEHILKTDLVMACQFVDSLLQKQLPVAQVTKLHGLKTKAVATAMANTTSASSSSSMLSLPLASSELVSSTSASLSSS